MPTLDTLRLARPCPLALAAFLDLAPPVSSAPGALAPLAERGALRRCGLCREFVVDTSALTREEADALAAREDRPACLAIVRDALGRTVHRPAVAAGAATGLALLLTGCGAAGETSGRSSGPFIAHREAPTSARHGANRLAEHQRSSAETLEYLTALGGYIGDAYEPTTTAAATPPPPPTPTPGGGGGFGRF